MGFVFSGESIMENYIIVLNDKQQIVWREGKSILVLIYLRFTFVHYFVKTNKQTNKQTYKQTNKPNTLLDLAEAQLQQPVFFLINHDGSLLKPALHQTHQQINSATPCNGGIRKQLFSAQ